MNSYPKKETEALSLLHARLDEYVDGTLPEPDRLWIDGLCERFPSCRSDRDDALRIRRLLRSVPRPSVPSSIEQRVMSSVRARRRTILVERFRAFLDRSLLPPLKPVLALATVAVIVVSSLFLIRGDTGAPIDEVYSQAEIDRALLDAKLALAYVTKVGHDTGMLLRDDVVQSRVIEPVGQSVRRAVILQTNEKPR